MESTVSERRGAGFTALAVAMGLLAVSNFLKPVTQAFDPNGQAGFVLFGHRLHGVANAIAGPIFGVALAAYAVGVWHRRRWVVPLAIAYAGYVIVNLVLFTSAIPPADAARTTRFMALYAAVAIGVSGGGAILLWRNRERLR